MASINPKRVIKVSEAETEEMARICAELTRQGITFETTLQGKEWWIELQGVIRITQELF